MTYQRVTAAIGDPATAENGDGTGYASKLARERRWYQQSGFQRSHLLNRWPLYSPGRNDWNYIFPKQAMAREVRRHLAESGCAPASARMLIVPIGSGDDLRYVGGLARTIVGADVSPEALARCRLPPSHKFLADMQRMTLFRDASFDLVLAPLIFHHFVRYDLDPFLIELRRVLRPGGWFITLEPSSLHPVTWLTRGTKLLVGNITGAVDDEAPFAPWRLTSAMKRCGFEAISVRGAGFAHNRFPVPLALIVNALTRPFLGVPVMREFAWMCIFAGRKPV